jgi:predicted metal-binding membrane protein
LAVNALEGILQRDRLVVLASLVALGLIAWLYLFHLAAEMTRMEAAGGMADMPGMESMSDKPGMADMPDMEMSGPAPAPTAALVDFALLASMWAVMMVGMMLPAAAPTILLFSALERKRATESPVIGLTALFVLGYFLVWTAFSVAAAGAQMALARAGLLSAAMATTSNLLGGAIFILAGLYEFSPLKDRCLSHCRSPVEWLAHHRRPGGLGALRMGIEHGAYCVGCCWVLMLLLFAGGVMNLLWVAALAAIVLVQKLFPGGVMLARLAGVVLIVAGVTLIGYNISVA